MSVVGPQNPGEAGLAPERSSNAFEGFESNQGQDAEKKHGVSSKIIGTFHKWFHRKPKAEDDVVNSSTDLYSVVDTRSTKFGSTGAPKSTYSNQPGLNTSVSNLNTTASAECMSERPVAYINSPPKVPPKDGSVMLALSYTLPPKMHRQFWSLADYTIVEKMYTGYASVVYKGMCKSSGTLVCLKIYKLSSLCELNRFQVYREVRLHASLQHENVVQLYAAFQQDNHVILVQEFAGGGDLFRLLQRYGGKLPERVCVELVMQPFLFVLHYLHHNGIVHRDLKPENILFSRNMCLKLCDFGLAIDLREERAVTRAGTLDYMAPEVLLCPYKSKPEENKENILLHYSNRVDTWAVGVLTYELLVGFPPFIDETKVQTENKIKACYPVFPSKLSHLARDFVNSALSKEPTERPTIYELLHHPWCETHRRRRSQRNLAAVLTQSTSTAHHSFTAQMGGGYDGPAMDDDELADASEEPDIRHSAPKEYGEYKRNSRNSQAAPAASTQGRSPRVSQQNLSVNTQPHAAAPPPSSQGNGPSVVGSGSRSQSPQFQRTSPTLDVRPVSPQQGLTAGRLQSPRVLPKVDPRNSQTGQSSHVSPPSPRLPPKSPKSPPSRDMKGFTPAWQENHKSAECLGSPSMQAALNELRKGSESFTAGGSSTRVAGDQMSPPLSPDMYRSVDSASQMSPKGEQQRPVSRSARRLSDSLNYAHLIADTNVPK